jgi:hypothetical protein
MEHGVGESWEKDNGAVIKVLLLAGLELLPEAKI